ncbi:hypothetical protein AGMMS49940_24470 [Spirochaetia bacterium]|nr:hypothetical protein AGMMS49940_24470 [Spirochaetia bacterium]
MKYTKMVCWINRDEQKEMKAANISHTIPIIIAKNKDDFISKIDDTSFLIVSLKKARTSSLIKITRSFPDMTFYTMGRLDGKCTTPNELMFLTEEPNVFGYDKLECNQFSATELLQLFESQYKGMSMKKEDMEFTLALRLFENGDTLNTFEKVKIEDIVKNIEGTNQINSIDRLNSYLKSISEQELNERKRYFLSRIEKHTTPFLLYVTRTK